MIGIRRRGREWYEQSFVPRIAPFTLYGLLFTIVLLFAIQGDEITSSPLDVVRIAAPLLVYFAVMWVAASGLGECSGSPTRRLRRSRSPSRRTTSSSRSRSRSVSSAQPRARRSQGSSGPLIEVPVLVSLVYVALWLRRRLRCAPAGTPLVLREGARSGRAHLRPNGRIPGRVEVGLPPDGGCLAAHPVVTIRCRGLRSIGRHCAHKRA